jgi:hypothetical protein
MIGVSVSGLVFNQMARPLLLEDRRREDLVLALDKINDRFGEFTIVRAPVLKTGNFKEDISDYGRISRFKI